MKTRRTVITEGALYVIIAAGGPFAEFLSSDREASTRALCAVGVVALIAGANALKAFLSQSMRNGEPMEVIAPVGEPLKVTETPKPKKK